MNVSWDDVQLFLAIAETGSLTAAARLLRLGQPTVSRRLLQVESELGYTLFQREASGATLTSAGERLLLPARQMAECKGELDRLASAKSHAPEGVVRLAAPPGVAFDFVTPFAGWLRQKHRRLRLEVLSSVHYLDLNRGEADLALRMRAPASDALTVVASLDHANVAVAAPSYEKTLPKGYGAADVDWICWDRTSDDVPPNPQLRELIPDFVPSFTSDNFLVQWRAAEAGLGAMVRGDVRHRFSGPRTLVPLKLDLGPYARSSLYLVCRKSALDVYRVRLVAELLAAELRRLEHGGPL